MRILITGAAGYVGSHLCRTLSKDHVVVGTLFRQSPALSCQQCVPCDIRDAKAVHDVFEQVRPEALFHLAYSLEDLEGSIIRGASLLADAWRAEPRPGPFVFLSTDVVFDGECAPYRESDEPRPIVPYGAAKKAAEDIVLAHGGKVARTSLVYGFDPMDERTRILFEGLETGRFPYPFFSDEMRCPIFVDDLCQVLAWMLGAGPRLPRILHVAGPKSLSRLDFAKMLANWAGYGKRPIPGALLAQAKSARPRDISLDTNLAKSLVPAKPRSVREVLCATPPFRGKETPAP